MSMPRAAMSVATSTLELLVALLDEIQSLVDALHRAGHGVHLHEGGVVQDACGQLLDLFGHGGAEHQVLALCGQLCDDLLHVMHKAHVQHPVGLVQHKDLEVRQVDMALSDEVVQTARAGNEDVHALSDGLHLRGLAHAAEDDGAAQFEVLAVGVKALADLESQLTGGGKDEGADSALPAGGGAKAAVLPVPVWAQPIRSRPSSTGGMAEAWMGEGVS